MTFSQKFADFLAAGGLSPNKFAVVVHVGKQSIYRYLSGQQFPKRSHWPNLIAAGVVKDEAEMVALKPPRKIGALLLTCPHCGCLIRRRTGKSLDDKFLHPPSVRMPVAQNLTRLEA